MEGRGGGEEDKEEKEGEKAEDKGGQRRGLKKGRDKRNMGHLDSSTLALHNVTSCHVSP